MKSETEILEQLNSIRAYYGEEKFVYKIDSRQPSILYFFFITDTKGVMYHDKYGSAEPFVVDPESKMFDVWTDDDHFVHYEAAYDLWKKYMDEIAEQELLQEQNKFKLPEGFRDAMEKPVVDWLTEGKDYNSFIRELSQDEADEMSDLEIFENYMACTDEEDAMVKTVKEIINAEKLEEIVNE